MKGIVFGSTFKNAEEKLLQILENYKKINIEKTLIKHNSSELVCIMSNGDYWQAVVATIGARGRACNIAYIDREISQEIINTVIMPTLKCFPYTAYNYYGKVKND